MGAPVVISLVRMKAQILRRVDEWGDTSDRELYSFGNRYGRLSKTAMARNRRVAQAMDELIAEGVLVQSDATRYARPKKTRTGA